MSSEDSTIQEVKINQSKINIPQMNNNSISNNQTQPNPITINNNIPELKLNTNSEHDNLSYAANILILIIGCMTFNPCLLLVNPCLKNYTNNENQKQTVLLSVIFGIILGILYAGGIFIYVILSVLSTNGNSK